ncbi:MAG: hypothetical protein P4L99_29305 [Chthoniobacter sp.]|nr:hypothetical protein [Chthoniobacter sp.]
MNYIKSPQAILTVTVLLAIGLILTLLRPESLAQTTSTVGGRFQFLAPKEDQFIIFDTASARTWQYSAAVNVPGGGSLPASWREISPPFAPK